MSQTAFGVIDEKRTNHLREYERHRLLASERRRLLLTVLEGRESTATLEDLAAAVADRESEREMASGELVERVKLTLHHNHLPKLDEHDVVDYHPESHRIDC